MATNNHERVGKAMELLREGLAPFVEREVDAKSRAGGAPPAVRRLVEDQRRLADKPIREWDVAGLLKLMWATWNDLFRGQLGLPERSLVSELRDWRNKWAHQERFISDDADRALDSAQRLLDAIGAPQADAVACIKRELRRLELDEEVLGERQRKADRLTGTATGAGAHLERPALSAEDKGAAKVDSTAMNVAFGDLVFWATHDAQISRDLRTAGHKFTEEVLNLCVGEPALGRREAVTRIATARGVSVKAALRLRLPAIQRCVDAVRERGRSQSFIEERTGS